MNDTTHDMYNTTPKLGLILHSLFKACDCPSLERAVCSSLITKCNSIEGIAQSKCTDYCMHFSIMLYLHM